MLVQPSIQLQHPPFSDDDHMTVCNQPFDFSPGEGPVTIHDDTELMLEKLEGDEQEEQEEQQEKESVKW